MTSKTIGSFAKNLIQTTQLSNKEILEAVRKEFPKANTSMACIAWYKSDIKRKLKDAIPLDTQIARLQAELEALQMKKLEEEEREVQE
jgi:hypothetical protein